MNSGVTRVGDTGTATEGVTPLFFPEKPGDLSRQFCSVIPYFFFSLLLKTWRPFFLIAATITITFYCFHSGVTPPGCHPTLFYLSDLVSPLFFVNLHSHFFSFGCHPLEGVTRGDPLSPPPPTSSLVTPLTLSPHSQRPVRQKSPVTVMFNI